MRVKKTTALSVILVCLITAIFSVACATSKVDVTFYVDGQPAYTYQDAGGKVYDMPTSPTKDGHKFIGWYVEEQKIEGDTFCFDSRGDVRVDALFEKAKKVTFMVANSIYLSTEYYNGDVVSFPSSTPDGDGQPFVGWYLNGVKYDTLIPYVVGDVDIQFVAGFANVLYVLRDYRGVEIESGMVVSGESIVLPEIPSRASHRIAGWSDDLGNLYAVGEEVSLSVDTTFSQSYEREYTLRYRYQDGLTVADSTKYLSGETTVLPSLPAIEGMTARGWYDSESMYDVGETYTITKNTILVAKYSTDTAPQSIKDEISSNYEETDPIYPHVKDVADGVVPTLIPYLSVLSDNGVNYQTTANKKAYITGYGMVVDNVMIEAFTFKTVPVYYNGEFVDDNYVGGIIVYPLDASLGEDAPGILCSYGGGGGIKGDCITSAIKWAKEGYVYCMVDMPGIGNPTNMVMCSGSHLKVGYGTNRFNVQPSVEASMLYVSVSSAIKGFSILYNSGLVNKDKIGTYGVSWGGYMTTYLAGALGSMLKVSSSTYGCGFYEYEGNFDTTLANMSAEDRATWLKYLDAGRRAEGVTGYYFVGAATNDTWFRPQMIENTILAMTNASGVGWMYEPNQNHTLPNVPGGTDYYTRGKGNMQIDTLLTDYYLKSKGYAPPTIEVSVAPHKNQDGDMQMQVTFTTDEKCSINTDYVRAYYAKVPTMGTSTPWLDRKYKQISDGLRQVSAEGGVYVYELIIPASIAHMGVDFFVTLGDVKDSRTFSLSTHMLNSGGLGIEYDGEISDEDAGIVKVSITNSLGETYTNSLLRQGTVNILLTDPIYLSHSTCQLKVTYFKNGNVKTTRLITITPNSTVAMRTITLEVTDNNGLEVPPENTTLRIELLDSSGNPLRIAKEISGT